MTIGSKVRIIGYAVDCTVVKLEERFGVACAVLRTVCGRYATVARVADLHHA